MAPFLLFLASLLEANHASLDWRAELECNILYAITSDEVLTRQMEQIAYDRWLHEYLKQRGIHTDLAPCLRAHDLAVALYIARDPHGYSYSRTYYLQEAKRCN